MEKQTDAGKQIVPRCSRQNQHASMASACQERHCPLCLKYAECQCAGCNVHQAGQTDRQTDSVQNKRSNKHTVIVTWLPSSDVACWEYEVSALMVTPANLLCTTCGMCSGHVRGNLRPHKQLFCRPFKVLSSAVDAQQRVIRSHTGKDVLSKEPGMCALQAPSHIAGPIICCQFT